MQAIVLSIGTELLMGEITDTNAQYVSRRFRELGIDIYKRMTVGDNPTRLSACFKEAEGCADIVLATGGLGPTGDDVTAEALADSLGKNLRFDETVWKWINEYFKKRGREPAESDRKQALIIEGAIPLPNEQGTAPGQAVFWDRKMVAILPGPPREMVPMFEREVVPLVRERFSDLAPLAVKDVKLVGIPESRAAETVKDLMQRGNPSLAPYVGSGEVRLRIAARGKTREESERMVNEVLSQVKGRLGEFIYGFDGDTLESVSGEILSKRGLTLAVAESITGGLISHRLTQVPGSSRYFKMGLVAYNPAVKTTCLGVPSEAVARDQAVNPEVARAMAENVRALAGAKIGLATTGFAGPQGGTPAEPVGTVYIALAHDKGTELDRQVYVGGRSLVKEFAAERALFMLWRHLTRGGESHSEQKE